MALDVCQACCEGFYYPIPKAISHNDSLIWVPDVQTPITIAFTDSKSAASPWLAIVVTFHSSGTDMQVTAQSYNNLQAVGFGTESYWTADRRLRFYPVAGEQHLDPEKALGCPAQFRFAELDARLAEGPVEFRVEAIAGGNEAATELGLLSAHRRLSKLGGV